jgi:uncharacterized membrane protein
MNRERQSGSRELVDVYVALALLVVAGVGVVAPVSDRIRLLVAFPTLFLLPGYALTTLLFPTHSEPSSTPTTQLTAATSPDGQDGTSGIGHWERAGLSFGVSVTLLPLLGLLLSSLGIEITAVTALGVVAVLTVVTLGAGVGRRWQYPQSVRYQPPIPSVAAFVDGERHTGTQSTRSAALSAALVIVVAAAVGSFALAVTAPSAESASTEASLLTRAPSGELVASGYPATIEPGQREQLILAVSNDEEATVEYSVVVQLQRLTAGDDPSVLAREQHLTAQEQLADGETWEYEHEIAPPPGYAGERTRVVYLIYRGEPPAQPRVDNAYRYLTLSLGDERTDETRTPIAQE